MPARILILSPRETEPIISRCGTIEFEDVVSEIDGVEFASSTAKAPGNIRRRIARSLVSVLGRRAPAARFDLLFVSVHTPSELARIPSLWRHLRNARFAACNVDEVWAKDVAGYRGDFPLLRAFDHLFTMCDGGAQTLSAAVGRPCSYLPPSVDALRFAPPDPPLERVIDLHLMGRRRPQLHEALSRFARETGRFYLFDSVQFSPRVSSAAEHRLRLANLIRRTHAFVVDVSNSDSREKTGGQVEFGPRYVEGAAGGAVLIGTAPATKAFAEQLGWPDSVIPVEASVESIRDVLQTLEANPARTERIRRENVRNVLLRHDVAHRWEQILGTFGLIPRPQLAERKERLARAAGKLSHLPDLAAEPKSCSA